MRVANKVFLAFNNNAPYFSFEAIIFLIRWVYPAVIWFPLGGTKGRNLSFDPFVMLPASLWRHRRRRSEKKTKTFFCFFWSKIGSKFLNCKMVHEWSLGIFSKLFKFGLKEIVFILGSKTISKFLINLFSFAICNETKKISDGWLMDGRKGIKFVESRTRVTTA